MKYKDYYKILGVDRSSSATEIQKAYRKLARTYHPDVNKAAGAEAKFKEIGEAYAVLGDKEKRRKYDSLGANWRMGQDFTPPAGWGMHSTGKRQEFDGFDFGGFSGGEFSDFFDHLFRDLGNFDKYNAPHQATQQQRSHGHRRGDQETMLKISLEDAFQGGKKRLSLTRTDNAGRQTKRKLDVKIPPGIREGSQIRLKGQGNTGPNGEEAGDLILNIRFNRHPQFTVNEYDLNGTLKVAPWEAVLGGKVSAYTLDGNVQITLKPGTQHDQKLKLAGKGMFKKNGSRGDLIFTLEIIYPSKLKDDELKLWQNLADGSTFNPR